MSEQKKAEAAVDERDTLKAEVEKANDFILELKEYLKNKDSAVRWLKAEVERLTKRETVLKIGNRNFMARAKTAEAALAEARPLIEAVIDLNETDILFKGWPSLRLKQAALGYREGRVVDEMKAEPGKVQVKYISTCPRCGLPTEHDDIIKPGDKFWSPETGPCEAIPAGEEGRKK